MEIAGFVAESVGGFGMFLIVREVFAKGLGVGIGDLELAAFVDADVED